VGRRDLWLPLGRGWREELVSVLQQMAQVGD
jgi:hypothetical protein